MSTLQDKGWNSMKQMLDAQMPVEQNRKPLFWWFLAPTLLLLLLVAGSVYFGVFTPPSATIYSEQLANEQHKNNDRLVSETASPLQTIQETDKTQGNNIEETNIEARVPSAILTRQQAGHHTLTPTTTTTLPQNASKNATEKENQKAKPIIEKTSPEAIEKYTETEAEPIAMRPAATETFDARFHALEPLEMKTQELAVSFSHEDLAAPAAIQLVPLVQNIFQLRAHTGVYIPAGSGISGASLGLSARFEFKSKWGLHGGVDMGYVRPYSRTDINPGTLFFSSQEEDSPHMGEQNFDAIKNYWLVNYYAQASYRPVKPVSMQVGIFQIRQLNSQNHAVNTEDIDNVAGGVGTNSFNDEPLVYHYRETYTGLQAGLFLHLSPRLSIDAQYSLATRSWFDADEMQPSMVDRGTHMHMFKVGASYRIL